jgi:hypothetical protein
MVRDLVSKFPLHSLYTKLMTLFFGVWPFVSLPFIPIL